MGPKEWVVGLLLAGCGSPCWQAREVSQFALTWANNALDARGMLQKAIVGKDPEVAWRAREALEDYHNILPSKGGPRPLLDKLKLDRTDPDIERVARDTLVWEYGYGEWGEYEGMKATEESQRVAVVLVLKVLAERGWTRRQLQELIDEGASDE